MPEVILPYLQVREKGKLPLKNTLYVVLGLSSVFLSFVFGSRFSSQICHRVVVSPPEKACAPGKVSLVRALATSTLWTLSLSKGWWVGNAGPRRWACFLSGEPEAFGRRLGSLGHQLQFCWKWIHVVCTVSARWSQKCFLSEASTCSVLCYDRGKWRAKRCGLVYDVTSRKKTKIQPASASGFRIGELPHSWPSTHSDAETKNLATSTSVVYQKTNDEGCDTLSRTSRLQAGEEPSFKWSWEGMEASQGVVK